MRAVVCPVCQGRSTAPCHSCGSKGWVEIRGYIRCPDCGADRTNPASKGCRVEHYEGYSTETTSVQGEGECQL